MPRSENRFDDEGSASTTSLEEVTSSYYDDDDDDDDDDDHSASASASQSVFQSESVSQSESQSESESATYDDTLSDEINPRESEDEFEDEEMGARRAGTGAGDPDRRDDSRDDDYDIDEDEDEDGQSYNSEESYGDEEDQSYSSEDDYDDDESESESLSSGDVDEDEDEGEGDDLSSEWEDDMDVGTDTNKSNSNSSSNSNSNMEEDAFANEMGVGNNNNNNNNNEEHANANAKVAADRNDEGFGSSPNRRKRLLAIGLAVLSVVLLAVAIGLGAGMGTKKSNNNNNKNIVGIASPTEAPVRMPVSLPTDDAGMVPLEVIVEAWSDTTVYRDGFLRTTFNGDEPTMLVQKGPPGDSEIPSAYALVQFSTTTSQLRALLRRDDEAQSSTAFLCLDHVVVVVDEEDADADAGGDRGARTYSACAILPGDYANGDANVDDLNGETSGYVMPDDCVGSTVVEFVVRPSDTKLCLDVSTLVLGSSSSSSSSSETSLRGRRRRRGLQTTNSQEENSNKNKNKNKNNNNNNNNNIVLMIDALEESDQSGDRFYTSNNDVPETAPRMVVAGKVPAELVECPSIYDTLCSDKDFSILCGWIDLSGSVRLLRSNKDISIFAPTNSAIDKILDSIDTSDTDLVSELLLYHVAMSLIESKDIDCDTPPSSSSSLTMANDGSVQIQCSNNNNSNENTFLVAGDGNSPDAMPRITRADNWACNGFIHVIDRVILPAGIDVVEVEEPGGTGVVTVEEPGCKTFVELACSKAELSALCQLSAMIQMIPNGEELINELNTGVFTVFAPDNNAALDLQGIDTSDNDAIVGVLLYHAVNGTKINSEDLVCEEPLIMANGMESTTECSSNSSNVYQVGGGNNETMPQIVEADIPICGGVVHLVDKILLPKQCRSIYEIVCSTPELNQLCTLIETTQLEGSLVADYFRNGDALTIFAPTNEAIETGMDRLNSTDTESILDFLLYHTVPGFVMKSKDIDCNASATTSLTTANDGSVEIQCTGDELYIVGTGSSVDADALLPQITALDIEACNGVVHVVDEVLLPTLDEEGTPPVESPPDVGGEPEEEPAVNEDKPSVVDEPGSVPNEDKPNEVDEPESVPDEDKPSVVGEDKPVVDKDEPNEVDDEDKPNEVGDPESITNDEADVSDKDGDGEQTVAPSTTASTTGTTPVSENSSSAAEAQIDNEIPDGSQKEQEILPGDGEQTVAPSSTASTTGTTPVSENSSSAADPQKEQEILLGDGEQTVAPSTTGTTPVSENNSSAADPQKEQEILLGGREKSVAPTSTETNVGSSGDSSGDAQTANETIAESPKEQNNPPIDEQETIAPSDSQTTPNTEQEILV